MPNVYVSINRLHKQWPQYSKQLTLIVQETPELYSTIVKPYIQAFPPSRTKWVTNILTGVSEADKVLYRSDSSEDGFLILPDMKWDLTNVSTLYLTALTLRNDIKTLRDLRRQHLPMLKGMRREATRIVKERWGLENGSLRFYVHYQPSYCKLRITPILLMKQLLNVDYIADFRPLSCTHRKCKLCRIPGYVGGSSPSPRRSYISGEYKVQKRNHLNGAKFSRNALINDILNRSS